MLKSNHFDDVMYFTVLSLTRKSRREEFHFGDSLMLLPYPCLTPHHPLSGNPSSHVWNPHLHLAYHHLHLVYHHLSGIPPSMSCIPPSMSGTPLSLSSAPPSLSGTHLCLVFHHITGTPPLSGIPSCVWNPIPSPVWYPTPVFHCHHLAWPLAPTLPLFPAVPCLLAIVAPIWPLTAPYPLICHPCLPTILNSCSTTPSNCHLTLLPPAIPSLPCHLALLVPTHCPIGSPPLPLLPQYPHPNLDLLPPPHQISSPKVPSTQKGNLSFSKFPSFLMFISISPRMGSISSHVKIISFTSRGKIPKIVVKQPSFHQ